jgi:hypothetical protein
MLPHLLLSKKDERCNPLVTSVAHVCDLSSGILEKIGKNFPQTTQLPVLFRLATRAMESTGQKKIGGGDQALPDMCYNK